MSLIIPKPIPLVLAEHIDYEFVDNDAHALTLKILREPFQGVVVFIGKIGLYERALVEIDKDKLPDGVIDGSPYELVKDQEMAGVLEFKYDVIKNKEWVLTKNWGHFELILGKIIENILEDAMNDPNKYDVFVYNTDGKISGLKPIGDGELDRVTPPKVSLWTRIKQWFTRN